MILVPSVLWQIFVGSFFADECLALRSADGVGDWLLCLMPTAVRNTFSIFLFESQLTLGNKFVSQLGATFELRSIGQHVGLPGQELMLSAKIVQSTSGRPRS